MAIQKTTATTKSLLTVTQAAKILKVSPDTLRNWEKSGKLVPERTAGGARRYQLSVLQELVAEKSPEAAPRKKGMLSISKAAKELGVSTDTLRNWEKKGQISADRTDGGARRYSKSQLTFLKKELGIDQKQAQIISPVVIKESDNTIRYGEINNNAQPQVEAKKNIYEQTKLVSRSSFSIFRLALPIIILILFLFPIAFFGFSTDKDKGLEQRVYDLASTVENLQTSLFNVASKSGDLKTLPKSSQDVLAVSSIANLGKYLEVNADTSFSGSIAVEGEGVFIENITAPNIVYGLVAGANVTISGDSQNPVISANPAGSTETLASVTARGASTNTQVQLLGGVSLGNILTLGQLSQDPGTGTNGDIYYNTSNNKYRCYINGSWQDCDTDTVGESSSGDIEGVTAGPGLTGGGDSGDVTLELALTTSGTTSSTSSNSGLEVGTDGLSLIRGCADNQILKWDAVTSLWQCDTDSGSGATAIIDVREGGVSVGSDITILNYTASDFTLTEAPNDQANVSIDYTNSGITRRNQAETISSNWTFSGTSIYSSGTPLSFTSLSPSISIGDTGVLTITDGTNTLLSLSDNGTAGTLNINTLTASVISGYTLAGNIVGSGSPTLSGLGTINGATISGGTLSGGTYTATGATVAGNYTVTIGGGGTFNVSDGTNTIFTVTDNGTVGDLTNIGTIVTSGAITQAGQTLDNTYVNVNESPAAGDITGTFQAGLTIAANSVALGTDTTGDYVATVSGGNGLTGSGTGEGSTPTLAVGAGTGITVNADDVAVNQAFNFAFTGDVSFTPSGTGNLTFTADADTNLILSNLPTGTPTDALCIDASENVITCANGGGSGTVTQIDTGNGLSGGPITTTGTIALGDLIANWDQNGAFDIVLDNASSELRVLESAGATFYGIFDAGDLSADATLRLDSSINLAGGGNTLTLTGSASLNQDLLTTSSVTFDTLTLTNALSVANGGTGAQTLTGVLIGNGTSAVTGTTTSSGISTAISDETGSGSLVFATSPSLTTPSLGVATATSINGLTLTANADGFAVAGGTTPRTLTVTGANVTLNQSLQTSDSPTFAGATISGLSTNSAVYTNGSSALTTTAPTSGTIGYWSRTSTTLSPATSNDVVSVTSNVTTSPLLNLSTSGIFTGTGTNSVLPLYANSATTGDIMTISGTALTTGTALTVNGATGTGMTDALVKVTGRTAGALGQILSTATMNGGSGVQNNNLYLDSTLANSAAGSGYGLYNRINDTSSNANVVVGYSAEVLNNGNVNKGLYGYFASVTTNSTTADTTLGYVGTPYINTSAVITTGTRTAISFYASPGSIAASTGGTTDVQGFRYSTNGTLAVGAGGTINVSAFYVGNPTMNTTGTSTKVGLRFEDYATNLADNNYAVCFDCDGTYSNASVINGLTWGNDANSVNLYRSANDTLRTDDAFSVNGTAAISSAGAISGLTGYSQLAGTFTLTPDGTNDVNITVANASGRFLNIGGLAGGTASNSLCIDGSSNVITCAGGGVGSGTITAVGSMTSGAAFADATADDDWLGLGASAGRIEFDDQTTDEINFLSANVGIGDTSPASLLTVGSGDLFQVNSSGNMIFNQTAPTISIGDTGSLTITDGTNNLVSFSDDQTDEGRITLYGNNGGVKTATVEYEDGGVGDGYLRFTAGGTNGIVAEFRDCCNPLFQVRGTNTKSYFTYGLAMDEALNVDWIDQSISSHFLRLQNQYPTTTQTQALTGAIIDVSSNWSVPNSSAGNQTGIAVTVADGGASATAIGISIDGTYDDGINFTGTPGTNLINSSTLDITAAGGITGSTSYSQLAGAFTLTPDGTNDVNITVANGSGRFLNIGGLAGGTAANSLCVDSSSNVITCTGGGVGGGTITAVGSMTSGDAFANSSADDDWLGLGASAGRIEFDDQATDEVNILDANVGIGDNTPASLLTVGSGDAFQVNSSGAIAAATGITSSGTITFSGLSPNSAIYTDGSSNLTTTAPTSGTLGYWSRTGTTLSPATANDSVSLVGPSGGASGITDGLLELATDVGNTGVTPSFGAISSTATVDTTTASATGTNLYLNTVNSNTTNANTAYGIYSNLTDATALDNDLTGIASYVTSTGNAAKLLYGYNSVVTSSSTTADFLASYIASPLATGTLTSGTRQVKGAVFTALDVGANTGGTSNLYGVQVTTGGFAGGGSATINGYGLYITDGGVFDTTGTTRNIGLFVEPLTGADTNIGICFDCDGTWSSSNVSAGIQFGTDTNSVNLYRSGSDILRTDDAFNVNGNANISSAGAISGATGISSSGTITFSGLSINSAIYTDGSSNLTTTAPTSGTIGYWSRTGTTLSPATSGDNVTTSGNLSTTGTGALSVAGATNLDGTVALGNATADTITFNGYVGSSILPSTDDTYDLGSDSNRWRDLYLGGDTLHIGTSTTDEATMAYNTSTNIFNIATDSTTNGDIAFFTDDLYLDKSAGSIGINDTTPDATLDIDSSVTSGANFGLTNTGVYTGTGIMNITANSATTGTVGLISATGLTTGNALSLIGGTALTTGSVLNISGASYNHTGAETGHTARIAFTDASTAASGSMTTTGLSIGSTVNTSGIGTKNIAAFNAEAPTWTGCATGSCLWSGYRVFTPTSGSTTTMQAFGTNVVATGINNGILIGSNITSITPGAGIEIGSFMGPGWDAGFYYASGASYTQSNHQFPFAADLSSNITVPDSAAGNQTGVTLTLKDGGASATSIGVQIGGTYDTGIFLTGTPGTNLIDSSTFDVSAAGVISGATGLTSSGTIRFSALTTNGVVYTSGGNGTLNSEANLAVSRGGTGAGSVGSAGSVVYSNGSVYSFSAVGSTNDCLISNGASAPSWSSCTNAANSPFVASAGEITKVTSSDKLHITAADAADYAALFDTSIVNTVDLVEISNTGFAAVNDGVDGLSIAFANGNGTNNSNAAIRIAATSGGTGGDALQGLRIDAITATAQTETAVMVGSNWDTVLDSANLDISGAGAVTGATGISSSGTIAFSGLTTNGVVYTSGGTGTLNSEANLAIARGGTNAGTIGSAGSLAYSTGTAYAFSGVGTGGDCLISGGTGSPTWGNCTTINADSLDYDDFEDTMDYDADLITNQGAFTSVQNFTGTTTNGLTYNADSTTTGSAWNLSVDALTTGKGFDISSTAPTLTSADLFNVSSTGTYTTAQTVTGSVAELSRSLTINAGATTLSVTGPVARVTDNCTVSAGTCTSTASVFEVLQSYTSNSGSALMATSAGSGNVFRANDDGTTTDSSPFIIDGSGNVAIGATTASFKLHLVQATDSATSGIGVLDATAANSGRIWMSSADMILQQGTNTNQLVLDSGGNVGLGLTTPSTALHIYKTGSPIGRIESSSANNPAFEVVSNGATGKMEIQGSGRMNVGYSANAPLYLQTNSTDRVTITGSGTVGIGTTSPVSSFVHILGGNDAFSTNQLHLSSGSGTTSEYAFLGSNSAGDYFRIGYYNGSTFGTVRFEGNVAVGQVAPDIRLDVNGGIQLRTSTDYSTSATNGSRIVSTPNLHLDSTEGATAMYFNYFGGTNGFLFCNGSNICSASISAAGAIAGSSVSSSGTVAGVSGVFSGAVSATGQITSSSYIQNQGVIYPGRIDVAGVQGSWYLASHASYGLYSNTGIFFGGSVYVGATDYYDTNTTGTNNAATTCFDSTGFIGRCTSDGRLKENISYINSGALDAVMQLKPATFDFISGGDRKGGFIAQDLVNIIPESVTMNPDGYYSFNSDAVLGYAVAAIKELNQKVDSALLTIGEDGYATTEFTVQKLSITADANITGKVTASDFALDASKFNQTGTFASLPQDASGSASIADAINALDDAQQDQENRIASVENQTASQSAQLADQSLALENTQNLTADLETKVLEQKSALDLFREQIESQINDLSGNGETAESDPVLTSPDEITATGSATIAEFNANTISGNVATISESLTSLGETNLANTFIAGDLTVDGTLSITNGNELNVIGAGENEGTLYLQRSPLASVVNFFDGLFTLDKTGSFKAPSVTVADFKVVANKISGAGTIKPGDTSIVIENPLVNQNARILVTPTSNNNAILAVTKKVDGTSFTVSSATGSEEDITFDWWMVQEVEN